jgi:hypothetical protein
MPRLSSASETRHPSNSEIYTNDADSSAVLVTSVRFGVSRHRQNLELQREATIPRDFSAVRYAVWPSPFSDVAPLLPKVLKFAFLLLKQGGGSRADCVPLPVESDDRQYPDFVRSRSKALLLAPLCELPPVL